MKSKYFPLVIVFLVILIYSNTFFSSFHFDDEFMLRAVADFELNFMKPRSLGYFSFAINYFLHAREVFGYHLVNTSIHILNSIFVYLFSMKLFKTSIFKDKKIIKQKYIISLFVSLIFASHPLQTQAVTYIVQRFASLAFLFFILGILFYLKGRLENKKQYFLLTFLFYIFALLTKINTVVLPLMILLIEFVFFSKENIKQIFKKNFILISGIIFLPAWMAYAYFGDAIFSQKMSLFGQPINSFSYFFTQLRVIPKYIQLLFLPINQNLDHYFLVSQSFFEIKVILGFVFLLLILLMGFKLSEKYPLLFFGIGWFFIGLLVESSFIPIRDLIFEHRLYLPMLGFSIFIVFGLYHFLTERFSKNSYTEVIKHYYLILFVLISFFSITTYLRNGVWKTDITLMTDVTQKSPKIYRGYNWLGVAYLKEKNLLLAEKNFLQAVYLNDNFQDAHTNLGSIYSFQGRLEKALYHFQKALDSGSLKFGVGKENEININIGLAYFNAQQYEEAFKYLSSALEKDPSNALAKKYLILTKGKLNTK